MRPAKKIEKLISKINVTPDAQKDKKTLDDILDAQEKTKTISSAVTQPNTWRIIMNSKTTKFATAAVFIAVAILSVSILDETATPAYAITDVPKLFRQADVVHVKGLLHFDLTDKGQKVPPQATERWIDLKNGRFRFSKITVHAGPEEVKFIREEIISDGQYKMVINHADKSAVFYKMSDLQREIQTNAILNNLLCRKLFLEADFLDKFSRIGEENIDGIMYDIWECEVHKSPQRIDRHKYWLSITGTSGRFQSWHKNIPQPLKVVDKSGKEYLIPMYNSQSPPEWKLGYDFYKIECNVQIPENVFKLEVPESYEAKNTKENAIRQ